MADEPEKHYGHRPSAARLKALLNGGGFGRAPELFWPHDDENSCCSCISCLAAVDAPNPRPNRQERRKARKRRTK